MQYWILPNADGGYLNDTVRMTRDHFLYIGNGQSAKVIAEAMTGTARIPFAMLDRRTSDWNRHIVSDADHMECLYRMAKDLMG